MTAHHQVMKDSADGSLLDAVVTGGSQAGLAMAWHLAQQGLRLWSWRPVPRSGTSGARGGTR